MNWKIGDKFLIKLDTEQVMYDSMKTAQKNRQVLTVDSVVYGGVYALELNWGIAFESMEPAVILNELNKKLYPNYIEYQGKYLIPPEAKEKTKDFTK